MEEKKINDIGLEGYQRKVHFYGRITLGLLIALLVSTPFLIAKIFGVKIEWSLFKNPEAVIFMVFYAVSCVFEVIAYHSLLGLGGSYIAFITGNLLNLKIPCAENSVGILGIERGTHECEIVSTMSIAVSAITTTIIIALGVAFLRPLTPVLEHPALKPGFEYVSFALFGALGVKYFEESMLITISAFAPITVLAILVPKLRSNMFLLLIGLVVGTIVGIIQYKRKNKKDDANNIGGNNSIVQTNEEVNVVR